MEKKILTVGLAVLLIAIIFCGCNEQNEQQNVNLITVPIISLFITIEDLPEGYSENYNGTEYTSEFSSGSTTESFAIWYSKGNISNPSEYDLVTCELNKYNSINDADEMHDNTVEYLTAVGNFEIVDGSKDIIGDESEALTKSGYGQIFSFRISNVIVVLSSTNYSFTLELAEIVEQKINNA